MTLVERQRVGGNRKTCMIRFIQIFVAKKKKKVHPDFGMATRWHREIGKGKRAKDKRKMLRACHAATARASKRMLDPDEQPIGSPVPHTATRLKASAK